MTSVMMYIGSKFNINNLNTIPAMWPLREPRYISSLVYLTKVVNKT